MSDGTFDWDFVQRCYYNLHCDIVLWQIASFNICLCKLARLTWFKNELNMLNSMVNMFKKNTRESLSRMFVKENLE